MSSQDWAGDNGGRTFGGLSAEVFETTYAVFKNPAGAYLDVTLPTVQVSKDGIPVPLKTLSPTVGTALYQLNRVSVGMYSFVFYTQGLVPGLYTIVFSGGDPTTAPNYGVLTITGGFTLGSVSYELNLVMKLRQQLMDYDPRLYTIIDQNSTVWRDECLLGYLGSALTDINMTPTPSNFGMVDFPYAGILIDGGYGRALRAASVLEIWNTMTYTDEISFSVDRSQKLQAAGDLATKGFFERVDKWKTWWSAYGDEGGAGTGQWQGENKLPFSISRVLSWLPGMKNCVIKSTLIRVGVEAITIASLLDLWKLGRRLEAFSFDSGLGKIVSGQITGCAHMGTKRCVKVKYGSFEDTCSFDHPFLLGDGTTYVPAELLKAGDFVKGIKHDFKVKGIYPAGEQEVYDLTVEKYHNFALGSGVITHNTFGL